MSGIDPIAPLSTAESTVFEDAEAVLTTLGPLLRAIASAGGAHTEAVLHNLEGGPELDLGHTIMAIANGHVTGREVGGPSTSLGLDVQQKPDGEHDAFGYRGFTSDGRELRCSSVYFRNAAGRIIAALCINVDVSALQQARGILDALLPDPERPTAPDEYIGGDLLSVMDSMITRAIRDTGKQVAQLTREDRITVLRTLERQGATQMRKSVEVIAARLGISRVTAYAYLDEARGRD